MKWGYFVKLKTEFFITIDVTKQICLLARNRHPNYPQSVRHLIFYGNIRITIYSLLASSLDLLAFAILLIVLFVICGGTSAFKKIVSL